MLVLNSCCCFSTKTGATIIAILDIVGGIIIFVTSLILFGIGITSPHLAQQIISRSFSYQSNSYDLYSTQDSTLIENDEDGTDEGTYRVVIFIIAGVCLVLGSFSLVFGSILLYGVRKESAHLMKVWIIVKGIILILGTLVTIAEIVIAFSAIELFQSIVGLGIALWLIAVVHSHRHKILNGHTTEGIVYSKPGDTA